MHTKIAVPTADAVAAWARIGERYERAVVQAGAADPAQRDEGRKTLVDLGAVATIPAVE